MLISNNIKVKWSRTNKKYYVNLGYEFTNFGDDFDVSVNQLSKGCSSDIKIKCDYCGEIFNRKYQKYLRSHNNGNLKDCCDKNECKKAKTKETNLKKYGYENPFCNEIIKEKIKNTNIERYGCKYPNQNKEIRLKAEQTCLQKYGVKNPIQDKNIRNKADKTILERYGFKYAMQNEEVKEKSHRNSTFNYKYDEIKNFIENNSDCKISTTKNEFELEKLNARSKLKLICKCGKLFRTSFIEFKYCNKRQCNECGRLKCSGENHYFWNGGKSSARQKDYHTEQYQKWKNEVFKRDNYTCQCCGKKSNGNIQAHHLDNYMDYVELRYNIDNGITLCIDCHKNTILGSFHNLYGTFHNTKKQFEEYLKRYKNGEIKEMRNKYNNFEEIS